MAYDFDGTNDFLNFGDTGVPTISALSGFVWAKGDKQSSYIDINAASGTTTPSHLWWCVGVTSTIRLQIYNTAGGSNIMNWATSGSSTTRAAWGFSFDGDMTANVELYRDGVSNNGLRTTTSGTMRQWQAEEQVGNRTDGLRAWDGELAELAYWDAVLSAEEHAALAKGVSPLAIRPTKLIFYAPLRAGTHDMISGNLGTSDNLPTQVEHPMIGHNGPIITTRSAPAVGGGTILLGTATETDSAFSINAIKTRPINVAAETDSAFAVAASKARAVGIASETDVAIAMRIVKSAIIGTASETDSAFSIGHVRSRLLGLATEIDSAFPVGGGAVAAILRATRLHLGIRIGL